MTNAHVSLQDFRHRLRRHLLGGIPGGPDGGGAPWLDGLVMKHFPSGNVLRVTFPHIYFARWFAPHKTDFSAAVKAVWPDADAPRLEYVLPGQPLPQGPALQMAPSRIPDALFFHADGSRDEAPLPGGARNAFPLVMARAVALREPGHSPFLLHGEKGTGKSHLLQHMAAVLARQGLRVILAPAARFFQHCPLDEQTAPLFWQQADALFLDDIQTLGGQPRPQRLLAALLKKEYTLRWVTNGREALHSFVRERPDLILMDLKMPEMNGIEATERIRSISPDIPIIAVTAHAYYTDKEQALAAGCNAIVSKPYAIADLKQTIERWINPVPESAVS